MISLIFMLCILSCLLWVGFKVTGALLSAIIWLAVLLPIAIVVCTLGLVCCCTLLLIPVGFGLLKLGFHILIPGI